MKGIINLGGVPKGDVVHISAGRFGFGVVTLTLNLEDIMKKYRFRRICTLHFMGWQISVEIFDCGVGRLLGPLEGVSP